jgi:hypothetical protein
MSEVGVKRKRERHAHPVFRDLAIAIVQRDRIDFDENLAGAGSRSRN